MSLATRCTACGTVFRVVQDQLKVSEGWVRCGRCNEVFNALESLFDLDHDVPPPWPGGEEAIFDPTAPPPPVDVDPTDHADSLVGRIDAQVFGARPSEAGASAAAPFAHAGFAETPQPLPVTQRSADDPPEPVSTMPAAFTVPVPLPAPEPVPVAAEPAGPPPPEFIRQADRQARMRDPRARAVFALAVMLLVTMLALQAAHHFRDVIAARWPATRPVLTAWCDVAACALAPPRRIDEISVDSTSLTRAAGPDAFRLSVTLRNRGALTLALPYIDLSLTDVTGQLVARKALSPDDFRVASPLIAPGADAPLQLVLSAGSPRVTGYTVEIFYP